jgi:hypothetical protein
MYRISMASTTKKHRTENRETRNYLTYIFITKMDKKRGCIPRSTFTRRATESYLK